MTGALLESSDPTFTELCEAFTEEIECRDESRAELERSEDANAQRVLRATFETHSARANEIAELLIDEVQKLAGLK